jgi:hypothetical protein
MVGTTQVVVCKIVDHLESYPHSLDWAGPDYVYRWYRKKGLLPENPVGFLPREEGAQSMKHIRVLIETRPGIVRNLENRESLIRQCNQDPGPWECRPYAMGSDFAR